MKNIFSNNNYNTGYKQRPFDSYKSVVDKLDEETKKKLDRQRQIGMICVVAFVFILIVVLALTGIGVDKSRSQAGSIFADKDSVLIECFGDSITEGYSIFEDGSSGIVDNTYPIELQKKLLSLISEDDHEDAVKELTVKNYGQSGSILRNDTYGRLSGEADIVLILYTVNNFITRNEYEGTLESNIDAIKDHGSQIFLLNYPFKKGAAAREVMEQCNNYISNVAKNKNITLIDVCSYFSGITEYTQDELFSSDEDHLTELGYTLMGDYVAEQLYQYYYGN